MDISKRFQGCLIGLAVGDYLGMPVEFCKPFQVKNYYEDGLTPTKCIRGGVEYPEGFYTDDTAMALCLAESLIEKGFDTKDQFQRYKKWIMEGYLTPFGDKAYGVGQNTLWQLLSKKPNTLDTELKHKEKQGGNGALMRCAPIALAYYKEEKELFDKTLKATIITHNNEMAVWTCIAHNHFIRYALFGYPKESFVTTFLSTYPNIPSVLKDALNQVLNTETTFSTTGYSLNTLIISLHSFLTTDTYKDCITKAIFFGGDTDTQGAVAGSLAGAYYGIENIPTEWITKLIKNKDIGLIADKICRKTLKSS